MFKFLDFACFNSTKIKQYSTKLMYHNYDNIDTTILLKFGCFQMFQLKNNNTVRVQKLSEKFLIVYWRYWFETFDTNCFISSTFLSITSFQQDVF